MASHGVLQADDNGYRVMGGVSTADATQVLNAKIDSVTGRLQVNSAGGSGTVTSVSVATANGFAGSVATATTTPAITLTTSINAPVLAGNGTAIAAATTTGSGSTVVLQGSPTLTTPVLGVATATSLAIGGATIGSNGLAVTGHLLLEGVTSTGATGTGNLVFSSSPSLTTPTLGVATATTINKVTLTAPATGSTLTIADGKTLTVSNSGTLAGGDAFVLAIAAAKTLTVSNTMTLAGGDSTSITFPNASATMARTDAAQTFTGTQTFSQTNLTANAITASSNAATVPITSGRNIVTNNSAATLTITLTTTSAVNMQTCMVQVLDATGVAQTITWVNTENSTVSAPTTSNGSTTLPLTVGFVYNNATSKWRCVASA